ncbi:hypothetical protein B0H14DRAFT_2811475 [Mycena olivaceomarginata]|nr:hypothetical protein B0H14DRAFT_2811475 [Mycena olivaceomarginata]
MMILGAILLLASSASAFPLGRSISNTLGGIITGKNKLTFNATGNFKVVSFSDMHMGERPGDGSWAPWGPANDAATQVVHRTMLDNENPSCNAFKANTTNYLDMVYAPTVARNIPFSSTHGNNNINHQEEIEYEEAHYTHLSCARSDVFHFPVSVTLTMSVGVPVYAKTTDWIPGAILWFFDSRSFVSGTGNGPDVLRPIPDAANDYWVDPDTVPNYIKLQRLLIDCSHSGILVRHLVSISDPSPGDPDDEPDPSTQGFFNNTYTSLDLPFHDCSLDQSVALDVGKGNVLAITSGYDHGESRCARSKDSSGIPICFNGHSGYGGYVTEHSAVRNGRVFDLNLKDLSKKVPTVKTWNSYEDDTTDDAVELGPDYMAQYN